MADYGRIYQGAHYALVVSDKSRVYDVDKFVFNEPYRNGKVSQVAKFYFGAPVNQARVSQAAKYVFCEFPFQDLAVDENTGSARCFAKLGISAALKPEDPNKTGPVTPLLTFIDYLNPTVNRWFFNSGTLSAGASVDIDLIGSLRNSFDEPILIDCLRYIAVSNTGSVPIRMGAADAEGLSIWTAEGVRVLPGGLYFRRDPNDTPLSTYGDTIKITNESGSASATYEIFLIGAKMGG